MHSFAHWTNIHQRAWEECPDGIDIDGKATFDLAIDNTGNHFVGFVRGFQILPGFSTFSLLTRQLGLAETVFHGIQRNLYFVANAKLALAVSINKFCTRNNTFGLQARVYSDPLVIYVDDHAGHN